MRLRLGWANLELPDVCDWFMVMAIAPMGFSSEPVYAAELYDWFGEL
tara:strand:- start:467 stop:607 length:141 start_codon:yes stop_codon:yes gene_type:complete